MSNYGYPSQSYGAPPPQQYYNAYVIQHRRRHDSLHHAPDIQSLRLMRLQSFSWV